MSTRALQSIIDAYINTRVPTAVLIGGPSGSGKTTLLNQSISSVTLPVHRIQAAALDEPERTISTLFHTPSVVTFDNLDLYVPPNPTPLENRLIASLVYSLSYTPALFIATTTNEKGIHPAVLHRFRHTFTLDALSYEQRERAASDVFGKELSLLLADVTPGFLWSDMTKLFTRLSAIAPDGRIEALPGILSVVRPALLSNQELVTTPQSLQGLDAQIRQLDQLLYAVFQSSKDVPASRALQRIGTFRGALIHGPTGSGKTALTRMAKQLVPQHTVNFLEVSSTQVVGSVIGEGERKLRRLFTIARAVAPSVVVIDNIDLIAPRRSDEDAGGATKAFERVLSTLLVLIDGVVKDDRKVLVIGTTRNLNLVDDAILRPGRFDLHISVQPPDAAARWKIMENFLQARGINGEDIGISQDFGMISEGWTAPDVLGHVKKKVLQAKANFI